MWSTNHIYTFRSTTTPKTYFSINHFSINKLDIILNICNFCKTVFSLTFKILGSNCSNFFRNYNFLIYSSRILEVMFWTKNDKTLPFKVRDTCIPWTIGDLQRKVVGTYTIQMKEN